MTKTVNSNLSLLKFVKGAEKNCPWQHKKKDLVRYVILGYFIVL